MTAQEAGLSRSLPADPVAPDGEFAVTINNVGLADGFGSVVETLPHGFSYVADSAASSTANAVIDGEVSDDGRTVTFTLVAVDSFTYKVTVGPDAADGEHTFSGVLAKLSGTDVIGGDSTVTLGLATTRSRRPLQRRLPRRPRRAISAGRCLRARWPRDGEFVVTINNVGLADGFGSVAETLPAGFSYVADSATSSTANAVIDVEVSDDGRTVTFTVVGVDSFTYKITVGPDVADGEHTFSGVLRKLSGDETIADSSVTVGAGDDTTTPDGLSRSLPAGPVAPDGEFVVTIKNVGLADGFGAVVETLARRFQLCGPTPLPAALPMRLSTLRSVTMAGPSPSPWWGWTR